MLFLAFYEVLAVAFRKVMPRQAAIIGLFDLAVAVFVVLAIFFSPAWWYCFVAIAVALVSMAVASAIIAAIGKHVETKASVDDDGSGCVAGFACFWICLISVLFMYLDLFDAI